MRLPRRELIGALVATGVTAPTAAQDQDAPKPPLLPSFAGQRILVVGGTGRVGGHAITRLLAAGAKVRGAARDIGKAKAERPDVDWVKADVKDTRSLNGLAKGCDRVLCAIGGSETDPSNAPELVEFKGVAALASEAKAAGAKHFALLSANAVGMTDLNANTPFASLMRFKKQGEEALAASGVPYTVLRPTGLWDRPGGEYGIALLSRGLAVSAVMCRADVAAVMVQSLSTAKAAGKTIHCFNVAARDPYAWMKDFPKLAV